MKGIKIGVLGANGQVGPVLLRRLAAEEGIEPIAVCRNRVGAALISDTGCEIRLGSVTDEADCKRLLDDCDAIVNCVWPVVPPKDVRATNESIVRNLSRLRSLKRVLHLSSVAVYGCIHTGSTFAHPRPDTPYGNDKQALERAAARVFSDASLDYFVIRLGHVFGPHQWLSRDVVDSASNPHFQLPFDGLCPSNAIHVEELAVALTWLLSAPLTSGVYNLASTPQQTWRDVFNWHTSVCGLPPVKGMAPEQSRALREGYLRRTQRSLLLNCLSDALAWLRSVPVQQLLSSGDVRKVGSAVLGVLPGYVKTRIRSANARRAIRREIEGLEGPIVTPAPWLYSDAMPGPFVDVPLPRTDAEGLREREVQLREWHLSRTRAPWSPGEPGETKASNAPPSEIARA
jgi:nucleoside-diphosphate-sugar epimerase